MSGRFRAEPWFREPVAIEPVPPLSEAFRDFTGTLAWREEPPLRYSGWDEIWPEHGLIVKIRND